MLLWIFTIAYKLFVKMRSWVLISFLSIAMFVVDLLLMSYLNYLVLVLKNLMVVTDGSILLLIYVFVLKHYFGMATQSLLWNSVKKFLTCGLIGLTISDRYASIVPVRGASMSPTFNPQARNFTGTFLER